MSKIYIKNNKAVGNKRKERQKASIQERNILQRMEESSFESTGVYAGRELYFENTKRKAEIEEQEFHTFPQVPRGTIQDIRNAQERITALENETNEKEFEQPVSVSRSVYAELINLRNLVEAENFLSVRREIK